MEIASAVFTLTLVMDPLGNIPLFITALKNVEENRRIKVITRELFIALFIMIFFLFFGKWIVRLLSIDIPSLSVAGGIVLFLIALSMIFPSQHSSIGENSENEPFIVPLAIPLVAGPSVLTTILIFNMKDPGNLPTWFLIVFISWIINVAILAMSSKIAKFLGPRGLAALEKLMGMILITISVQMLLGGIKKFIVG
ncbi:MAG: NAAT family transporter [Elusimicrobia bacterium]|nr:NAAT family transporter [Elusimicrobiota bacterium]